MRSFRNGTSALTWKLLKNELRKLMKNNHKKEITIHFRLNATASTPINIFKSKKELCDFIELYGKEMAP